MFHGWYWLDKLEGALSGALLAAGLGIVALEIFGRSVLGASFLWSEEVSRYLLIWMTYFGVAAAVRDESHIRVIILLDRFSGTVRRMAETVICIVCVVFAAFVTWFGLQLVQDSRSFSLMSADSNLPVPIWMFQSIIPIGFALVVLRFAQRLVLIWRGVAVPTPDGAC